MRKNAWLIVAALLAIAVAAVWLGGARLWRTFQDLHGPQ